jgi:hypothetical protein
MSLRRPSQSEISKLNHEIDTARKHIVKGKFLGSVFIRCNHQLGAHVLAQCVSYHKVCVDLLLIKSQQLTPTSPYR